jgi:hypothetical protein
MRSSLLHRRAARPVLVLLAVAALVLALLQALSSSRASLQAWPGSLDPDHAC